MSTPAFPAKDPTDILDYTFDFSAWMVAGDTLTGATIDTSDPILTSVGALRVGSTVTTWLSGGVANHSYSVGCTITTAAGRTARRTARLSVNPK